MRVIWIACGLSQRSHLRVIGRVAAVPCPVGRIPPFANQLAILRNMRGYLQLCLDSSPTNCSISFANNHTPSSKGSRVVAHCPSNSAGNQCRPSRGSAGAFAVAVPGLIALGYRNSNAPADLELASRRVASRRVALTFVRVPQAQEVVPKRCPRHATRKQPAPGAYARLFSCVTKTRPRASNFRIANRGARVV
jgi:hypothetical protein